MGCKSIKELERAGIIYEKEDHCCSSGSCCDFGGDRDYLCPGTDTGTDLMKGRYYHERKQKAVKRGT